MTVDCAQVVLHGDEVADGGARLRAIAHAFAPDATLLYVRHPADNLASLQKHVRPGVAEKGVVDRCGKLGAPIGYGWRCGTPAGKLRALEAVWRSRDALGVDGVVRHRRFNSYA